MDGRSSLVVLDMLSVRVRELMFVSREACSDRESFFGVSAFFSTCLSCLICSSRGGFGCRYIICRNTTLARSTSVVGMITSTILSEVLERPVFLTAA